MLSLMILVPALAMALAVLYCERESRKPLPPIRRNRW